MARIAPFNFLSIRSCKSWSNKIKAVDLSALQTTVDVVRHIGERLERTRLLSLIIQLSDDSTVWSLPCVMDTALIYKFGGDLNDPHKTRERTWKYEDRLAG